MKRNGFTCPLHPLQVLSWGLYLGNLGGAGLVLGNVWPDTEFVLRGTVGFGLVLVLVGTLFLTCSDPTDCYAEGQSVFCYTCKRTVGMSAKHCLRCERCVTKFDHHCKWVNNCVGEKNYSAFVQLSLSVLFLFILLYGMSLYVLVWAAIQYDEYLGNVEMGELVLAVAAAIHVESMVLGGFVVYLLGFHVWLWRNGMTTYEYYKNRNRTCSKPVEEKQNEVNMDTEGSHLD